MVLNDGRVGTVRFVGPVHFQSGIFVGVELDRPHLGENDGSVNDWSYFKCPLKRGIFVKQNEIKRLEESDHFTLSGNDLQLLKRRKTVTGKMHFSVYKLI